MVRSAKISVKDVLLLVGTMKGLFLFRSNASRRRWQVGGPFFPGRSVYGVGYDGREGRHRIWAAPAWRDIATPLPASCEIAILPAISGGKEELKIED